MNKIANRRILAYFNQPPEYINFCIAEIKSLFALHNIPPSDVFDIKSPELLELVKQKPYKLTRDQFPSFPFIYIKDHSDELLKTIISRSILIKSFVRVFSEGDTVEELIQNVDREEVKDFLETDDSFSFMVDAYNRYYK